MAVRTTYNQKLAELYKEMHSCNNCPKLLELEANKYNGWNKGPLKGGGATSNCRVMFVGQNPSYRRFKDTNCAFTGGIGDKFRDLLHEQGITHGIFVTNAVKCSTPKNRQPNESETRNCIVYIEKEVDIIKPRLVVLMGKFAINALKHYTMQGFWMSTNGVRVKFIKHPNYYLSYLPDEIDELKLKLRVIAEEAGYV